MKVTMTKAVEEFQPVTVTIVLETVEDARNYRALTGFISAISNTIGEQLAIMDEKLNDSYYKTKAKRSILNFLEKLHHNIDKVIPLDIYKKVKELDNE